MDFSNVFTSKLKGSLGSVKSTVCNSVTGALNEQLIRFKSYLLSTTELSSGVLETIASSAQAISDQFIEHSAEWTPSELAKVVDSVDDDWAQRVHDAIGFYGTQNEVGKGILLTDSEGRTFSITTVDEAHSATAKADASVWLGSDVDDVLVGVRTMSGLYPLVFKKDDVFKLNNVIPSSQSKWINTDQDLPDTIQEQLRWILDDAHVPYVTEDTIDDLLVLVARHIGISASSISNHNILTLAQQCCTALNLSVHSTIDGNVDELFDHFDNMVQAIYNRFSTFWDVIHDCLDSLGINRALLMLIEMIRSEKKDISTFLSTVEAKAENIKVVILGAVQAWNNGGYSGLADYILSFWHTANSVVGEDGVLNFTDNTSFVPTQYIAGVVATGIQIVSTIVGVVVSALGYAVGPAIALAGQAIAGIIKSINYDSTKTRCAIQTGENAIGSISPWALTQLESTYYNGTRMNPILHPCVNDLLSSNAGSAYMLSVPGGFLLVGRGAQSDSQKESDIRKVRIEFHPAIVDCYDEIYTRIVQPYVSQNWDNQHSLYEVYCTTTVNYSTQMLADIEQLWAEAEVGKPFTNETDDYLSVSEDNRLKNAIAANTALYYLWLSCLYFRSGTRTFAMSEDIIAFDAVGKVSQGAKYTDGGNIADWFGICMPHSGNMGEGYQDSPNDTMLVVLNSWKPFAESAVYWKDTSYYISPLTAIDYESYYGEAYPLDGAVDWGLVPAEYDGATFWSWVIATAIITVAVIATTIVAAVGIKRWRRAKANMNRISAERAYDALKQNPTQENLKAYNKAVTKNNIMSSITGGSKINKSDYWGSTDSTASTSSETTGDQESLLSRLCGSPETESFRDGASVTGIDPTKAIMHAITGSSGDPV